MALLGFREPWGERGYGTDEYLVCTADLSRNVSFSMNA